MREYHVQFFESLRGKSLRATHRNIYVKSERSGLRVMASIRTFITKKLKLKLKINESKSAVARPGERKFLGFSFIRSGRTPNPRKIAEQSIDKLRQKSGFSPIEMLVKVSIRWLRNYIPICMLGWLFWLLRNAFSFKGS